MFMVVTRYNVQSTVNVTGNILGCPSWNWLTRVVPVEGH